MSGAITVAGEARMRVRWCSAASSATAGAATLLFAATTSAGTGTVAAAGPSRKRSARRLTQQPPCQHEMRLVDHPAVERQCAGVWVGLEQRDDALGPVALGG